MGAGVCLRVAGPADAAQIAEILRLSQRSLGFLPELHSADEDLAFVSDIMLASCEVIAADSAGDIVGFAAHSADWLNHLYLLPGWTGQGIGTVLLDRVRQGRNRLQLWTFQANQGARRFYERHGFAAVEFTDGSGNEENLPDVRYVWERQS
ncbi:MAG: GNAT family N-acetyltransferase [Hyphomicrobiaceae bacterium]|nr:GNAT family N-acetyltransferase [Hyphomicrobiaceae bacterium]